MILGTERIELSDEGQAIVKEANRVFLKNLLAFAAVFGLVNIAALAGIYVAAQRAAEVAVSSRVEGPVAVVNEMLSATMGTLGEVRGTVGGLQVQTDSALDRVNRITGSLNKVEGQETRINAAAELLSRLDIEKGEVQFVERLVQLEKLVGPNDEVLSVDSYGTTELDKDNKVDKRFIESPQCVVGQIKVSAINPVDKKKQAGICACADSSPENSTGHGWYCFD